MKKLLNLAVLMACLCKANSQELYVYTEPASNMPAHTITAKARTTTGPMDNKTGVRYNPELMFGISKKLMLHTGITFSNMYSDKTRWESVYLYGKYRFLSKDEVHKHFRMAAFAELAHSRNRYRYEEVNLSGDRSGAQAGIIATELLNKLAVSATISHTQALDRSRWNKVFYDPERIYQSVNYSLSTGYLLLPGVYKNYNQTNLNIYTELLAQQTIDRRTFYVDLAPALQAIINSNTKINAGYRFQLNGNQTRAMTKGFIVSVEHTFFNVFKKRPSKDKK